MLHNCKQVDRLVDPFVKFVGESPELQSGARSPMEKGKGIEEDGEAEKYSIAER
jgi:hypothetical protein